MAAMHDGFAGLGLMPELLRAIDENGWMLPYDVQDEAIPLILGGGDVLVAAETGSGKTGAFALPLIQIIYEDRRNARETKAAEAAEAGGAAAGMPSAPPCVWNSAQRSPIVSIDDSGLVVECKAGKAWGGARATNGIMKGKYYFEVTMNGEGIGRVGWSLANADLNLGTDMGGYGFGGTGKKANNGRFDDYGQAYGDRDVIGCALNRGTGVIEFFKNGASLGAAFTVAQAGALYPTVAMKGGVMTANFGDTPFAYPAPAGFSAVNTAPMSDIVSAVAVAEKSAAGTTAPLAMIIEPTKDLAEQTFNAIQSLKKHVVDPAVRSILLIGGVDHKKAVATLAAGVDIVVGTPQCTLSFAKSGHLDMNSIRAFVLDEADDMCDEESLPMIKELYNMVPQGKTRVGGARLQVCFFSATLHAPEIIALSESLCQHPTWVDLKGKDSVPDTVHHCIIKVDPDSAVAQSLASRVATEPITDGVHARDSNKGGELTRSFRMKQLKPALLVQIVEQMHVSQALIFCRTNVDCNNLEQYLTNLGGGQRFGGQVERGKENQYSCCVLAGMRALDERRRNLQAFKEGQVRFLIATDVAARGIDVQELPYVINMTLPDEPQTYIHRIGRVGRADRLGLAISLVGTYPEKVWYHSNCKDRGRNCSNTKLLNEGGCCTWYDEPSLLRGIEARVGQSINEATITAAAIEFPAEVRDAHYGEVVNTFTPVSEHVMAIASSVQNLAALEVQAQSSYLALKSRFAAGTAGRGTKRPST